MKKYIKPYICTTVKASILDNISTSQITSFVEGEYSEVFGEQAEYGAEETW